MVLILTIYRCDEWPGIEDILQSVFLPQVRR